MVSKLVKIAAAVGVFALSGHIFYNKVTEHRNYEQVYEKFKSKVSQLHSPDSEDLPTCQEWVSVCSDIGFSYDPSKGEQPRPTIEQMESWLDKRR